MRGVCALAVVAASIVATVTTAARAEPTDQDRSLAATLFDEAKTLIAAGNVAEACRKLEESRRLNPLPGTILNLAVCHESEGRYASAMAEFRDARALAVRDHRDDRIGLADQHLAAILPRVAKIVIVVGADADVPGLTIMCDATPIGRAAWGTHVPVDAGEHHIIVSAPGRNGTTEAISVRDGDDRRVSVSPLTPASEKPNPLMSVPPPRNESHHPLSTRHVAAIVTFGAAVTALGVGTGFGVNAISQHGASAAICTTDPCPDSTIRMNDDARRSGNASTVMFSVGVVALLAATYLWFVR